MSSIIKKTLVFTLIGLLPMSLQAEEKVKEEVRFDKSELAKETTLPVFRNHKVVQSRTVKTAKRFEVGLLLGKTLNDAFFDNFPVMGQLNYHINEKHGVQLEFGTYSASQNSFVESVRSAVGSSFSLDNIPLLEGFYSLLWEYTPYYGKISFSKETVYNLAIYTTLGYGQVNYTNSSSSVLHAGIGQKLYFSPNWGLKLDLRTKTYQFPDIFASGSVNPAPPFEEKTFFNTELTVGMIYLFPSM
jgi:outer membrane beta-barrel protein